MYLRLTGAALLLFMFCLPVAAEPIRVRISSSAQAGSPIAQATDYLSKLIEERSGGRILIKGQAANVENPLEQLANKQSELGLLDKNQLSRSQPQLQIFNLLFLFEGQRHLYRVLDSDLGEKLLAAPEAADLINLSFWDEGFSQLAAQQPLLDPTQVNGLTITVSSQQAGAKQYATLGATPLSPGSAGQSAVLETSLAQLGETASNQYPHLILSSQAVNGKLLVASRAFWQQLPRDLQVIVVGAVKDATRYARELSLEREDQLLKQLAESSTLKAYRLTPQQKKHWQNQLHSIYPQIVTASELKLVELIIEQKSAAAQ